MQELAAKTQAQGGAASNTAGQAGQAPPAQQQVQGQVADLSALRRDTAGRERARAAEVRQSAAVQASPPAAPSPAPRWEYLDLASAEQRVGFTIPVIPGLQVDSVALIPVTGGYSVRIIHRLPGDGRFELSQEPRSQALELRERVQLSSVAEPVGMVTVTIPKGNLQLTGRAQLPADSIRALLNRAR